MAIFRTLAKWKKMETYRPFLTTLSLIMLAFAGNAQRTDSVKRRLWQERYSTLLIGLSAGSYVNGEAGFARITVKHAGFEPASLVWFASDEIRFANKLLMGPKIGVWGGNGPGLGLNMIYYTDFGSGTLVFRPEIGGAVLDFKIMYGYNFKLTNTGFNGINKNLVEFAFGLKH